MSDQDDRAAELQKTAMEELMKQEEMRFAADKLKNMPEGDTAKM